MAVWLYGLYCCIAIQWARDSACPLYCPIQQEIAMYCCTSGCIACRLYCAGRDAEPSAGRVSVEVIVTLNHCTELTAGTPATGGKRGFDVRCRVAIDFMLDIDAEGSCKARAVT